MQKNTNPVHSPARKTQLWQAHRGQNLRDILITWSPQANVELSWEATENYLLEQNVLINDTFDNAVIRIFTENLAHTHAPEVSFVKSDADGSLSKLIIKDRNSS